MSRIQHLLADRVLKIIGHAPSERRLFTYRSLSAALKRELPKDARAMAQVCDLLDAAAVLGGVPLYALVRVRNIKGEINPMAWRKDVPDWVRSAVIRSSELHEFSNSDIASIANGLVRLDGLGNRAAWSTVNQILGRNEVLRRVTQSDRMIDTDDAINDLGADSPAQENVRTIRYRRDARVRQRILNLSKGHCEFCGEKGFLKSDGEPYIETHHVIALASEGADRVENVVALCASHHREAHFGANREVIEQRLIEIARNPKRQRPV